MTAEPTNVERLNKKAPQTNTNTTM